MKTKNPDFVIISCPLVAELHGFALGETVPVLRREINCKDPNGYEIYVHSPRFNRSLWLSSAEYSLEKEKEVLS